MPSKKKPDYSVSWNKTYGIDKDPIRKYLLFPKIKSVYASVRPRRIVDLGCGNGNLAVLFKDENFVEYVGIDENANFIETATQSIHDDRIRFISGDISKSVDLASGFADLIFNIFVINEIRDIASLFAEMHRLLNQSGKIFVVFTHPFLPLYEEILRVELDKEPNKIQGFSNYFAEEDCEYVFTLSKDRAHYVHHNFEHVQKAIAHSGLYIASLQELTTDKPEFREIEQYWQTRYIPKFIAMTLAKH